MALKALESYFDRLWPICRSITGNGLRDSFKILQEIIPLALTEVPTGAKVGDWEIPKEWNINDAYIIDPDGNKICDFKVNNLYVVNYAIPVNKTLSWEELKPHLYYREDLPEAIPYVTSYYQERWGFCLSYLQYSNLPKEGKYKVVIDSQLKAGALTYGQLLLPGDSKKEILFSSYLCHPSMANNELSGPLVLAFLYQKIAAMPDRKFSYRFVLAPETIGILAFLEKHGEVLKNNVQAGYVLTCCGDNHPFKLKHSRKKDTPAEHIAKHVLDYFGVQYSEIPFAVGGSDERQYCSPGMSLPIASITRSMYHEFKEYHTSLDNKDFISFEAMAQTVNLYFDIARAFELNDCFISQVPFGEPQLGKRGLYPNASDPEFNRKEMLKMMTFLAHADGNTPLWRIAEIMQLSIFEFQDIVQKCMQHGLVKANNKNRY